MNLTVHPQCEKDGDIWNPGVEVCKNAEMEVEEILR